MATLSFDVFWRDHGAERGMKGLSTRGKEVTASFGLMKNSAGTLATVGGAAMVAFGKHAIDTASDISESQSKVGVVFGASAKSVLAFGDTSAKSLGISKASALEAAGTFGNLLVSLKLPQAEAAKMSTRMITLAADMASFNNASPEEALEAIRAGLVGETEPLRRFGVNMNDATLRTEAMKLGLISNTKDALDPAVKAQAAYSLMLSQTGTAAGDFARTSSGMANQQRILKAEFSDLSGELGAKLLPVANKTLGVLVDFADIVGDNLDVIVPMVASATAFAAAVYGINKALAAGEAIQTAWEAAVKVATIAMDSETAAAVRQRAAMLALGKGLGVVAVAAGAVWTADKIGQWETATVDVRRMTAEMEKMGSTGEAGAEQLKLFSAKGILGMGDSATDTAEALDEFGTAAYNALDKGWDARLGRWQDMGSSVSAFKKQAEQLDAAFAAMVRDGHMGAAQNVMGQYERAARDAGVPVASLRKMFPEYAAAVDEANRKNQSAIKTTKEHSRVVEVDTDALVANARALIKNRGSQNDYEAAVDDATQSLKDNGRTLDAGTEKGRANRDALDRVASATLDWRDAAKAAGKSQAEQTKITERGRDELVRMGRRFGLSRSAAKKYADEILGIPKRVNTKINLDLHNGIPRSIYGVRVGGGAGSTRGGITFNAAGGAIRGPGTGTSDDIPAMLSNNEHVWTAKEVAAAGGHAAVMDLRRAVLTRAMGGPVKLAAGGWPGDISGAMGRTLGTLAGGTASRLGDAILAAVNKAVGGLLGGGKIGTGWQRQWAVVHAHFPNAQLTSSYRPGAVTVSGNTSYHARGRAIDVSPSMAIFNWIRSTYGRNTAELIFSPAGSRQIKNGRPHYYTGAVRAMHFNHVHWAYDRGGMLQPGMTMAYNGTGRPERVLSAAQTRSFDRLTRVLASQAVAGSTVAGADIDYGRLGETVTKAFIRAGITVKMDSRTVGSVIGNQANLRTRTA